MRITPKTPEVRVPKFVGLMAVDAREAAAARGVQLTAPDRPDFRLTVVDYVVRQYPPPDTEVPRGAVVTVWFDLADGEGHGGSGVNEPRMPGRAAAGCSANWKSRARRTRWSARSGGHIVVSTRSGRRIRPAVTVVAPGRSQFVRRQDSRPVRYVFFRSAHTSCCPTRKIVYSVPSSATYDWSMPCIVRPPSSR